MMYGTVSNISPDVSIMTRAELASREAAAFHRGVERGKFEAASISARPYLFCWAPQRATVEATFRRPFDMRLRPIHEACQMLGIEGGLWIDVVGHPCRATAAVWETIAAYGWTIIRVDDCFARARAAR